MTGAGVHAPPMTVTLTSLSGRVPIRPACGPRGTDLERRRQPCLEADR